MSEQLRVGQVLYGYCGGIFGRDSYGEKRIEAIGFDWVVVREENGCPYFASTAGNDISKEVFEYTVEPDEEGM